MTIEHALLVRFPEQRSFILT